jgi:hypothetical protein
MRNIIWSMFGLSILTYTSVVWSSIPVSQLQNHCMGEVVILNTFDPSYSSGEPPHGRFSGNPASAGFKASVQFANGGAGCSQLNQKYQLELYSKAMTVFISVPPVSLQNTAVLAKDFVGTKVPVQFVQYFHYAYGNQLPLFPLFHEEVLGLSGQSNDFSLDLARAVDSAKVYGVPDFAQLNDDEKLSVALAIVKFDLVTVQKPGWDVPFTDLLSSLEPSSTVAKVKYLNILISLLTSLPSEHVGDTAFFKFEVGGSSGVSLATEINKLATETQALSPQMLQNLVFLFPALLININSQCLPIDASGMLAVLADWETMPLTYYQKLEAKLVTADLSGGGGVFDYCLSSFAKNSDLVKQAALTYGSLQN